MEVCISMYTKQQQLQYLHQLQKLQQLNILKDDVHLTYQYRNRNHARATIHQLQDDVQNTIVDMVLDGGIPTSNEIKTIQNDCDFDARVENAMEDLLVKERKRIHKDKSRFIDHVVETHTAQYTNFMKNRLTIEANRIIDKAIIIEGQALENGATAAEARQAVKEYAKTHGKARTKNMIQDAVHSQECNVSFIRAIEDEWRYKVWMNGHSKSGTRAWHISTKIAPVPIDEYFEIYGPSGKALAMYPGDLGSGAENVANCKCWLRYTNNRPSGLGMNQRIFNVPESSYLNTDTRKINVRIKEAFRDVGQKVTNTASQVRSKVKDVGSSIRERFKFRR